MPTPQLKNKMPFWKLFIAGSDVTNEMKYFISDIAINYEINKLNSAEINVNSKSYIEDYFLEGTRLEIKFGWSPTSMIDMFKGVITTPPQGQASDKINYTIVANGEAGKMGNTTNQRVFSIPKKDAIINQVIAENGLTPYVDISDIQVIPADQMPMQRNMTDLQFIMECAKRWHCVTWQDDFTNIVYFVDANKAHNYGNNLKKININDLKFDYELGYRTTGRLNNVADLKWSFGKSQGTGEAVTGTNEDGVKVNEPEDYDVAYQGVAYKLKPEFRRNATALKKIVQLQTDNTFNAENSQAVKQYFVPVKQLTSRTNKQMGHTPDYARKNIVLDIDLNIGDPYLRPPRVCTIKSGTLNPKADNADLPGFLFTTNALEKYKINKVKTSISNGMMQTKLEATR